MTMCISGHCSILQTHGLHNATNDVPAAACRCSMRTPKALMPAGLAGHLQLAKGAEVHDVRHDGAVDAVLLRGRRHQRVRRHLIGPRAVWRAAAPASASIAVPVPVPAPVLPVLIPAPTIVPPPVPIVAAAIVGTAPVAVPVMIPLAAAAATAPAALAVTLML